MKTTYFSLGANLSAEFSSDNNITFSKRDLIALAGHLPGIQLVEDKPATPDVRFNHWETSDVKLQQNGSLVNLQAPWGDKLSPDFVHIFYGAARLAWLKNGINPIHAACIGNDQEGFVLLVGHPGVGKSSTTLHCALQHNLKVFSGDKTLINLKTDGTMSAIAGTHTMTIREEDLPRWPSLNTTEGHHFGDRFVFEFPSEYYTTLPEVKIRAIILLKLNDGQNNCAQLTSLSALHTLYPYFMDTERSNILVSGGKAILNGETSHRAKSQTAERLGKCLHDIPVFNVSGSLSFIASKITGLVKTPDIHPIPQSPKKILYGICGIGNGHTFRQVPVVDHLLRQGHQILMFAYGASLKYFTEHYTDQPKLTVVEVANPYFVGSKSGLDFEATLVNPSNQRDFHHMNSKAMAQAQHKIGRPDIVISDYECVSAQYGYAKGAPLVTFDQQSKYLVGEFPENISDTSCTDEVERLRMFFPKAELRLAVSFFQVPKSKKPHSESVEVFAPVLRSGVIASQNKPLTKKPSVLVYFTAQKDVEQPFDEMQRILNANNTVDYHIFLPRHHKNLPNSTAHLHYYHHGDKRFQKIFAQCHGVISTAGHSLLSEAMYLAKPVYAIPLKLYEQQMNALVIHQNGFGIKKSQLTADDLAYFIEHLHEFTDNINKDRTILLKGSGQKDIIQQIDSTLSLARPKNTSFTNP